MADGPIGLPRTDSLTEAGPSNRLSDEEDRQIAAQIQECFDGCALQLQPCIEVFCHGIPDGVDSSMFVIIADRAVRRVALDGNGIVGDRKVSAFEAALRLELEADGQAKEANANISDGHLRQFSVDGDGIANGTVKAARELANKLVEKFQPLAVPIARLFRHTGVPFDDLKQEASLGLRRAALNFKPRDGSGFAAYARTVIRNHLTSVARISMATTEHYARRIEEFRKAEADLLLQGDPCPSEDAVFDKLGWTDKERTNLQSVLRIAHQMGGAAESDIDQVLGDADPPDASMHNNDLVGLRLALSQLTPEDQLILSSRYSGRSFPEIARQLRRKEHQVRLRHNELLGVIAIRMQQGKTTA